MERLPVSSPRGRRAPRPRPNARQAPPHGRRRHVVYLTRNTEYHCRDRECVGVRDRRSGVWSRGHPALRSRIMGAVSSDLRRLASEPTVGMRLVFETAAETVMTTRLRVIGRPDREAVFAYTSLCRAGEIAP